jgi:hypothetical protein
VEQGDGQSLPYADDPRFFGEAYRVLKPGAFFAVTEHGLGHVGNPQHPLPWSTDGSGAYLLTPPQTRAVLEAAGFEAIRIEDTGPIYLAAYKHVIALANRE